MISHQLPRIRRKRESPASRKGGRKQVLSVRQIEARYPSQWILLKDPVVDKHLRVLKGEVVCHSKDRDEVDRQAIELRLKHSAFLYTGKMPKDAAIVL